MNRNRIEHFFEADTPQEEIEETIELALKAYFDNDSHT